MSYKSLLALKARRKENGLCISCGGKLPDGCTDVTCEDCKNYQKSDVKDR